MVSMNDIRKLADRIAEEFKPERIILFGSYAHGIPGPDSDVDLLVLDEYTGKSWDYATNLRNRLQPSFPLDIIVRSPKEFQKRMALGDQFMKEIFDIGMVLYEADNE